MVEEAESPRKRIEDLIAISLYHTRVKRVRELLREIYKGYEGYLKPLDDVRDILAREMPGEKTMSQEVIELRS